MLRREALHSVQARGESNVRQADIVAGNFHSPDGPAVTAWPMKVNRELGPKEGAGNEEQLVVGK